MPSDGEPGLQLGYFLSVEVHEWMGGTRDLQASPRETSLPNPPMEIVTPALGHLAVWAG
jgi:hypothetical protein